MQGWIKLHRKILDSSVFDNPNLLKMWIWCLVKATHKDYTAMVGLEEVELKAGQFITGRSKGSLELNMNPSSWYKYLKRLEKLQMVSLNSNNKMTTVTVQKWELYQSDEFEKEQQNNNKITTKEQQNNTYKNNKNNKNNIYILISDYTTNEELRQALKDFLHMRRKIKAPMTKRALKMLLTELDKLGEKDELKIKIVEQSILNNWKSVYPLKKSNNYNQKNKKDNFSDFEQRTDAYTPEELDKIARRKFNERNGG